eukprot:TRINITY_DN69031_c0_g1_i1.p1 TRINITY_DN69031_c0_g1~~TRINITY_DN69031_c0_g1_i1.p1  ORF type:complete len:322 (+),score=64.77 TRINITY_DN69031_c0_g1_i1:140-1105(+)
MREMKTEASSSKSKEDGGPSQPVEVLAKEIVVLANEVVSLKRRLFELTATREEDRERIGILEERLGQLESSWPPPSSAVPSTSGRAQEESSTSSGKTEKGATKAARVSAARWLKRSLSSRRGGSVDGGNSGARKSAGTSPSISGIKRKPVPKGASSKERNPPMKQQKRLQLTWKRRVKDDATFKMKRRGPERPTVAKTTAQVTRGGSVKGKPRPRGRVASTTSKKIGMQGSKAKTGKGIDPGKKKSGFRGVAWNKQYNAWVAYYTGKDGKQNHVYFRRHCYRHPGKSEEDADKSALKAAVAFREAKLASGEAQVSRRKGQE